jgi:hypothetical protein
MPEAAAPNITEFNTIAGLIFAQLYDAFPLPEDIDRPGIAEAMGANRADWPQHILPSARTMNHVMAYTIGWLKDEGYIRKYAHHSAAGAMVLSEKALRAMNATPSELNRPVGLELKNAAGSGGSPNLSAIGDLIGGIFGGYTKSLGG